LEEKNRENKN
jgi:hypothetical protein